MGEPVGVSLRAERGSELGKRFGDPAWKGRRGQLAGFTSPAGLTQRDLGAYVSRGESQPSLLAQLEFC